MKLRLLVDRGQLEVFGNDGEVYQSHNVNFDSLPGGDGIELFAEGPIQVESLTAPRARLDLELSDAIAAVRADRDS